MGIYGELSSENPVEELKFSSFISKESETSVLKIFKFYASEKLQRNR